MVVSDVVERVEQSACETPLETMLKPAYLGFVRYIKKGHCPPIAMIRCRLPMWFCRLYKKRPGETSKQLLETRTSAPGESTDVFGKPSACRHHRCAARLLAMKTSPRYPGLTKHIA